MHEKGKNVAEKLDLELEWLLGIENITEYEQKKTRRVIPKYKSLEINGKRQNDNLNRSK